MKFEDELLNLLIKSPNTMKTKAIAEKLEFDSNFAFSNKKNDLLGVWEHRKISYSSLLKNILLLL